MDSSLKSADASRGELEERLRALTASEATLTQQLQATKGQLQQVGTVRGGLEGRGQGRARGPKPNGVEWLTKGKHGSASVVRFTGLWVRVSSRQSLFTTSSSPPNHLQTPFPRSNPGYQVVRTLTTW